MILSVYMIQVRIKLVIQLLVVRKHSNFEKLPQFTPEFFMRVTAKNVMKGKQFQKGVLQLVQEGAIQYFKTLHTEEVILGAVGQLQFEVFEHRMSNEYNVEVRMEPIGSKIARWIENEEDVKESMHFCTFNACKRPF